MFSGKEDFFSAKKKKQEIKEEKMEPYRGREGRWKEEGEKVGREEEKEEEEEG